MNEYDEQIMDAEKIEVISAIAFTDKQKERLESIMDAKFPYKEFEYDYIVDVNLLGGVILKSKSFNLEASYRRVLDGVFASVFEK